MKTFILAGLCAGALTAIAAPALAADAAHGGEVFRSQSGVCHVGPNGDGDGSTGPNLSGVIGRKVGGDPNFAYSQTLSDDKAIWTQQSVADFLADPQKVKPGTSMPISIKSDTDRADIAAYLASAK
jgi:cytochrome c